MRNHKQLIKFIEFIGFTYLHIDYTIFSQCSKLSIHFTKIGRNLKGIFKHHLWKNSSKDLHLTFIASSIDVGYRRPVIPSEKDGVVLQLGSNSNFSEELLELFEHMESMVNLPSLLESNSYFQKKSFHDHRTNAQKYTYGLFSKR